jgi:hypothetical protein
MELDPEYLRQHYASLSDEALLAVDRTELVELANMIVDEEVSRRDLPHLRDTWRMHEPHRIPGQPEPADGEAEVDDGPPGTGDNPS